LDFEERRILKLATEAGNEPRFPVFVTHKNQAGELPGFAKSVIFIFKKPGKSTIKLYVILFFIETGFDSGATVFCDAMGRPYLHRTIWAWQRGLFV